MSHWLAVVPPRGAAELSERRRRKMLEAARREVLERTYNGTFAYPFLLATLGLLNGDFAHRTGLMVTLVVGAYVVVCLRVMMYRRARANTTIFAWPAYGHLSLGVLSSGVLSVYACSVFVADGGTPGSAAGFVTVAGVAAMVVTIASVRRALALLWVWSALSPVIITLIWLGDVVGYGLGLMFAYFAIILTAAVSKAHRAYWDAQLNGARLEEHAAATASLSRRVGMAEVATEVLHNVGNTLNSVRTTVAELSTLHARDPHADLQRIAAAVADPSSLPADRYTEFVEFVDAVATDAAMRRTDVAAELGRLCRHVEHIERVVARQQHFAREVSPGQVCVVEELVATAVDLLGRDTRRRCPELRIDVERSLVVSADRDAALQVLVNLLKNAIEAAANEGSPHVEVSASTAGSAVSIRVRDNGVGAAPETVAQIFQRGYTTKPHGHGFGLHSAKTIANAMGGVVDFDSPGVGRGATATLRLPRPTAVAA